MLVFLADIRPILQHFCCSDGFMQRFFDLHESPLGLQTFDDSVACSGGFKVLQPVLGQLCHLHYNPLCCTLCKPVFIFTNEGAINIYKIAHLTRTRSRCSQTHAAQWNSGFGFALDQSHRMWARAVTQVMYTEVVVMWRRRRKNRNFLCSTCGGSAGELWEAKSSTSGWISSYCLFLAFFSPSIGKKTRDVRLCSFL